MQDYEIVELIQVSSGMFGSYNPSTASLTAFGLMLQHKFPSMTGDKIVMLCTEVAVNPPKDKEVKFTPSFLASILKCQQKQTNQPSYTERETSTEQKIKYRQEFLKDVAQIFEAHKHGQEIKYFFAWQYVAELLVRADYTERLPKIAEEKVKRDFSQVTDVFSSYKPFVLECFDRMIKNNQHISDVIHGIN